MSERKVKDRLFENGKELITGFLAILIVLPTISVISYIMIFDPANMDNAERVITLLGPWVGMILGYYFGRVSGDAATKAAKETAVEITAAVERLRK